MNQPPPSFCAIIDKFEQYCSDNGLDCVRQNGQQLTITSAVQKGPQTHVIWHRLTQMNRFHVTYEAGSQFPVPSGRMGAVQQIVDQRDPLEPETLYLSGKNLPMYARELETSNKEMTPSKIDDLYLRVMIMLDEMS